MAVGNQTPLDQASEAALLAFVVQQQISQVSTMQLARVVECTNAGGIVPTGTLTVQLLVNMVTGDGVGVQHGELFKVPYSRISAGPNAVIMDPQPGDIGLVGFCERDISAVKATRAIANPSTKRQYSKADGVWIVTIWSAQPPSQYVVMTPEGVRVVSPTAIELQAPVVRILGALEQSNGDASFAQSVDVGADVTAQGEVTAGNIPLTDHGHPTAPTGPISGPQPL